MRAEQAKRIALQGKESIHPVLRQIKRSAKRGDMDIQWRTQLEQADVDQLRQLGYNVTDQSNQGRFLYIIKWD